MGYALVLAPCLVCKKQFSMNPVRVPSFKVNGVKEPVCEPCVKHINKERIKLGVEPFVIAPDAYEACHEEELV